MIYNSHVKTQGVLKLWKDRRETERETELEGEVERKNGSRNWRLKVVNSVKWCVKIKAS